MTYTVLDVDGTESALVMGGSKPTLAEMQAVVGGYIERVTIRGGELWVNEEGRLHGLPVNDAASVLAGGLIVGRVLKTLYADAVVLFPCEEAAR